MVRVASYRLSRKLGVISLRKLRADTPQGPFFVDIRKRTLNDIAVVQAWGRTTNLFGHHAFAVNDNAPDWLANPMNGKRIVSHERDWWQIPDFDPAVGDIKLIWELSRMDWVLAFAQRTAQGDTLAQERLNKWLADWCAHNPPYLGPNWKCGQEASIRLMHLCVAALILDQVQKPAKGLLALVKLHLQRIVLTVSYAMAQDNNHGTSEAAALFMGGSWLATEGVVQGEHWARMGRRWLENRAKNLIGEQGSFSQYSLNYHRVMLDTFCIVEVWRRHLALPAFSECWRSRTLAATQWLRHMLSSKNGDGPNVGANDGANLLPMTNTAFRDYRPTVQLAMALFAEERAYVEDGPWNDLLKWLKVPIPSIQAKPLGHYEADDGGFAILRRGFIMVMLRYPRFRFRPSQSDVLHLDLWLSDLNLLRDAGTYSYNAEPQWLAYFGGTASHNTVQFDGRDQMPRISRFLLGDWLKTENLQSLRDDGLTAQFAAGYTDRWGARHNRSIALTQHSLTVKDSIGGFNKSAVLRWRLAPGLWVLIQSGDVAQLSSLDYPGVVLTICASISVQRCELVQGWESRHYLEKIPLQVLEFEVNDASTITTKVTWSE